MPDVIVLEGLEIYNLSNLTMIAAQYDKLKNATNALSKLGSMQNEGDLENPESSNGRLERDKKDDSFSVIIRKYCTLHKEDKTALPCIRDHASDYTSQSPAKNYSQGFL